MQSTPLRGSLLVPADKSISHRAAIISALAEGDTRIENFLDSETARATVDCLRQLGAEIDEPSPDTLIVRGRGLNSLHEPNDVLFCKGSGTTMRLLAGVCAGQPFVSILDGTIALKRRPMGRIVEPLSRMGAQILGRAEDRLPPLAIRGGRLKGIAYETPIASAQVKSAILCAGLFADSSTTVIEPGRSRDHTERMLRAFGAKMESTESRVALHPGSPLQTPGSLFTPSDFSSAAFFVVAALLVPRSKVCIPNVGINPTRTGLLEALARMGAKIVVENRRDESGEPVGDLAVEQLRELKGTQVSGSEVPGMIDEFPIFAIAATQAHGETVVRDACELRVKESDRITALTQELRKMGAQIEERADGFAVEGPARLHGASVNAHGDHRLAMALAVAGLLARGETVIEGWECVADSFPNFERLLLTTQN